MRKSKKGGSSASPSIHWREAVVLAPVTAHLLFLPWALGSMSVWTQQVSLGAALAGLLVGTVLNPPPWQSEKIPAWKKLLRSPFVWIGLLFLGYIATQGLNPAFRHVQIGRMFWMVPIDHISWLPAGMETPFERMNPFRHLIVFSSALATFLTILLFMERGKTVRLLGWCLVLNGIALATIGFAQLFSETDKILWTHVSANPDFYATFIYRNHAAGYLNGILALSLGLYFYYRERAWKTQTPKADISPVFFFSSLILFTLVLFSHSRTGILVAAALIATAAVYSLTHAWRWHRLRETSIITAMYCGLFAVFCGVFLAGIGKDRVMARFEQLFSEQGELQWQIRWQGYQATWEMFQDAWLFGRGAGSFEYAFPAYQQNYPDILHRPDRAKTRIIWEYAHNDLLQFPAEYGVAGMAIILLFAFVWTAEMWRKRGFRNPLSLWLTIGMALLLVHAAVDFVLQNPAIVITASAAMAIALKVVSTDRATQTGLPRIPSGDNPLTETTTAP